MAGALLAADPDIVVATRGTHVVEGLPMSMRTRAALVALGVNDHSHRSRQLTSDDIRDADLILAMAREHVQFVRRTYSAGVGHAPPPSSAWRVTFPPGPSRSRSGWRRCTSTASNSSHGRTSTTRPAATRRSSTSAPTRSACLLDQLAPALLETA